MNRPFICVPQLRPQKLQWPYALVKNRKHGKRRDLKQLYYRSPNAVHELLKLKLTQQSIPCSEEEYLKSRSHSDGKIDLTRQC